LPLSDDIFAGVPLVESPLFTTLVDQLDWSPHEREIAVQLHERGFAVIDFPDPVIHERIDRIKRNLSAHFDVDMNDPSTIKTSGEKLRIQDAWRFDDDVRSIAANPQVLNLLERLYGRRAIPFQTLNFPVGTQQHLHSDSIHFSSIPERFMCGIWLAMENVGPDAGPLTYLRGSNRWPVLNNSMIGRRGWRAQEASAQTPFEAAWDALVQASTTDPEVFLPRKGQALIWAANLLHGGSALNDPTLTRWSQVTHYYFSDCIYYTPAFSDEPLGRLDLRTIENIATGEIEKNLFLGEEIVPAKQPTAPARKSVWPWARSRANREDEAPKVLAPAKPSISEVPADFDGEVYLRLNPDVAAAQMEPAQHYLCYGFAEGRPYRSR
jgi:hypothetical protein